MKDKNSVRFGPFYLFSAIGTYTVILDAKCIYERSNFKGINVSVHNFTPTLFMPPSKELPAGITLAVGKET